jgi:type I restriction enzyme R subunit
MAKIDLLFCIQNTFDWFWCPTLERLYIGRVIKAHNVQTLTRVNRTYKNFRYGYVVDSADIQKIKTIRTILMVQSELGDEMEHYSNIFKSQRK